MLGFWWPDFDSSDYELHTVISCFSYLTEIRPCYGDADLRQKEDKIKMLEHDIYELEKETNKLVLFIERGGSK